MLASVFVPGGGGRKDARDTQSVGGDLAMDEAIDAGEDMGGTASRVAGRQESVGADGIGVMVGAADTCGATLVVLAASGGMEMSGVADVGVGGAAQHWIGGGAIGGSGIGGEGGAAAGCEHVPRRVLQVQRTHSRERDERSGSDALTVVRD